HGRPPLHTQPYRPRTNGKVERFIQTLLRECAYARPYRTSNQRAKALARWLRYYNAERPHTALGYQPPLSRIRRSQSRTSLDSTARSRTAREGTSDKLAIRFRLTNPRFRGLTRCGRFEFRPPPSVRLVLG